MKTTVMSVIRDYLLATKRFDEGRTLYEESGGRAFKKWILSLGGEGNAIDDLVDLRVRQEGGWECLCARLFYPEKDHGEVDSGTSGGV